MVNSYLKLFVDGLERYRQLTDEEFGRLVRAALRYKKNGEAPGNLGREGLLWDGLKLEIDRDNESYEHIVEHRRSAGKRSAQKRAERSKTGKCSQEEEEEQEQEQEKEEEEEPTPSVPLREGEKVEEEFPSFDVFWEKYPKQTGKKRARDLWEILSPDQALAKDIFDSLERWKESDQWKRENGRFVPSAENWLRDQRWEDSPPPSAESEYERQMALLEELCMLDIPENL